jgi:hypothetical protein
MDRLRLYVFLAVALVAAVAAPLAVADEAAAPEAASLEQFLASLVAEVGGAEAPACAAPAAAAAPVGELDLACSCIPRCNTNRDCDRVCGKGLGQCVQVNSCCKECVCAVAFGGFAA